MRTDAERVLYSQRAALANNRIFFVTNWFYFSFLHCPKSTARNNQLALPPHPLPVAPLISSLPRRALMFLVGCCVIFCCLAAAGVFVVIVGVVAVLAVLFVITFVALVIAITLP